MVRTEKRVIEEAFTDCPFCGREFKLLNIDNAKTFVCYDCASNLKKLRIYENGKKIIGAKVISFEQEDDDEFRSITIELKGKVWQIEPLMYRDKYGLILNEIEAET